MEENILKEKLCRGVEPADDTDEYRKIEKVLAPFMRTLKKRKKVKTDVVADEYKELYMKNSPKELLVRLEEFYADPVGVTTLLNETAELLKVVTKSRSYNLYLIENDKAEMLLISKHVPDNDRFEKRFPIETGTYLAPHVAFTKEYVISSDVLGDVRFPQGIPFVGATAKSAICVPIITDVQENCIGVIELFRDCFSQSYDLVSLQICSALTAWLGIAVDQNAARLKLAREVDVHMEISQLASMYFSGALSFEKIISDFLEILKTAVNAEKGGFYVFQTPVPRDSDESLYADAYEEGFNGNDSTVLFKKRTKVRFVKNGPGIPGYAARTGEIINVRDAYKDSRFDRATDSPFFRTRSVVCIPIKNVHGVLAVLKLINRLEYSYFRKEDIDLLQSHTNDMGLVCQYYQLDTALSKTQLKLVETERLLDYHMKPSVEEVTMLKVFAQNEQQLPLGFHKFEWDSAVYDEDSHKIIAQVFYTSEILEPCFEFQNLADFILRVRKAHRPVSYHNFEHAFCVFHCAYNIITRSKDVYAAAEIVTILLAALCHDIDHSGLTNGFVSLKNDTIYQLYEDFCGETHRYETAMFLIQATNLFSKVSSQNYQVICKNFKKMMLGFDLTIHFQNRKEISSLLNMNLFDWENAHHKYLSQNMILMCADQCYCFKSFDVVKKFTSNIYKELQQQGDLEKSMEFEPLPLLDRAKSDSIPENQIIFMTTLCIPVVQIVVTLFPNLTVLSDLANQTLGKWKEIVTLRGQEMWKWDQALIKERKERRGHRVSVSRSSSIRTFFSEK